MFKAETLCFLNDFGGFNNFDGLNDLAWPKSIPGTLVFG